MQINSPSLFIEINNLEFIFIVIENTEDNNYNLIYKNFVPIQGFKKNKIINYDIVQDIFQKNIYFIEQKFKIIFNEVVIILDNFDCSVINFSGFKKLNGSQLVKENITYILNSSKSKIDEAEKDKTILHIFNSKFILDNKTIDNLPIGLFGNFYSQELSFYLINKNDYKNIQNILNNCNLSIKKIFSKNFIEGVKIINENSNLDTFFRINIDKNNSQIIFFENASLKFVQNFNFGTEIITNDISKMIGLKNEMVKDILQNSDFTKDGLDSENIEEKFFNKVKYRKIRKNLILEIAKARIQEFSELILTKNTNLNSFLRKEVSVFFNIKNRFNFKCLDENFKLYFSYGNKLKFNFLEESAFEDLYFNANSIVQYGWKKEAVPIVQEKKSLIARFFNIFSQ